MKTSKISLMHDKINILLTYTVFGGNFLKFVLTNITSVLENNKNNRLRFYIMNFNMSGHERTALACLFEAYNQEYILIEKPEKKEEKLLGKVKEGAMSKRYGHYQEPMFYRLLFPEASQAKDREKILYLDAGDVVVDADLKEFYNMDFEGNFLIGQKDLPPQLGHTRIFEEIKDINLYMNSGVLLMNIKGMREMGLLGKAVEVAQKYKGQLVFPDQDILNILFHRKMKFVGEKFIKTLFFSEDNSSFKKSLIYHYTGNHLFLQRPFLGLFYNKKYYRLFYGYLDKTTCKNWRPPFFKSFLCLIRHLPRKLKKKALRTTNFLFDNLLA